MFDWLFTMLKQLWDDTTEWLLSFAAWIVDNVLGAFATLYEAVSVPDWLSNGLSSMMGALPDDVVYFLDMSGLSAALAILAAGVLLRMVLRFLPGF